MRQCAASATTGHNLSAPPRLLRFAACAAFLFAVTLLVPEDAFAPLNRHTASMVARFLEAAGHPPLVDGTVLSRSGFSIRVVSECTALYMSILFLSFIAACRASRSGRIAGLALGIPFLHAANILRIAAVFELGIRFPAAFEAVHAFAGQVVSALLVVGACLVWRRTTTVSSEIPFPSLFLLRFLAFSAIAFLVWLPLNKGFVAASDHITGALFSLYGYALLIPYHHGIYFHTFSVVTLFGMVLAEPSVPLRHRLRILLPGCAALFALQILFRVCNVLVTAFHNETAAAVSLGAVLAAQHLIPLLAWLALRRLEYNTPSPPAARDDLFRPL